MVEYNYPVLLQNLRFADTKSSELETKSDKSRMIIIFSLEQNTLTNNIHLTRPQCPSDQHIHFNSSLIKSKIISLKLMSRILFA